MILGTYWYFGFPTGLYEFEYFEFIKGTGGHANTAAELVATFEATHPEKLMEDLYKLVDEHPDGRLFVYREKNIVRIEVGGYNLFDYEFLLVSLVEKLLKQHSVRLKNGHMLASLTFTKIAGKNTENKIIYPKRNLWQIVGSPLKKYNAENLKLRLDCHITSAGKTGFIAALKHVCIEEKIEIFFYNEKEFNDQTNLILFFTNGRQGLHFRPKKFVDIATFENKTEQVMLAYNATIKHVGGCDYYPKDGPKIELMIEEEFII